MKKILALLFLLYPSVVFAQDSLNVYNNARNNYKATGMKVLGSWALLNIGISGTAYYHTNGQAKYFHQMDVIWNVFNLGIATLGYIGTQKDKGKSLNTTQSLKEQQKTEKIFLINGALDLAYVGGGIYLKNRGDSNNSDKLRGYGSSVIMQGAFLLLFDATMYTTQRHNGNKLKQFLLNNPINFDGKKLGMVMSF